MGREARLNSEFHSVGLVVLGKGEARRNVLREQGSVLVRLDILDECTVDSSVQRLTFSSDELLLGALLGEDAVILLLSLVVAGELFVGDLGNVDALNRDLGAGGQRVHLVDALKGHAVELVGTGHQQQATLKLLQENDSMAAESAGKEDEHSAWFETLAQLGDASLLGSGLACHVLSRVPLALLLGLPIFFGLFDH